MYETFRNELLTEISKYLSKTQLRDVGETLDKVAYHYSFGKAETALTTVSDESKRLAYLWGCCKKSEERSNGYIANSCYYLNHFFNYVQKPLSEVKPNDIRLFLMHYQIDHGIKDVTKDKIREVLLHFFTWCVDESYLEKNPVNLVKPIKCVSKPRIALTDLEVEHLKKNCKSLRDKAIIETFLATGCRVSELANAKVTDINFNEGSMEVFGKGKKIRTVYFNAKAIVALEEYFKERTDNSPYLIKSLKGNKGVTKAALEKVVKRISLDSGKAITPHILRHTFATSAVNHGMPITDAQALLGHSNINTTMIYVTTNEEKIHDSYKKYVV